MISIIITCHNQAHLISDTLNSVINQTMQNWECIVVDDGSIDESASIIKDYVNRDVRFRYIYQLNKGVANARNNGFKHASGDYIQFIDGDDTIIPQKLEKQLSVFQSNPDIAVCICDHQHYYINTKSFKHFTFETLSEYPLEQLLYKWHNGVAFTNHAPLYRRDIWKLNELPFPIDYNGRSEDWVFNVLVALKQTKYYYLNEILCNYHVTGENYSTDIFNSSASAIHAAFYLVDKIPVSYRDNFIDHTIKKSFDRYADSKKIDFLHQSGNWLLGNIITKPFFTLIKIFKR